jgi:hypothetical protein
MIGRRESAMRGRLIPGHVPTLGYQGASQPSTSERAPRGSCPTGRRPQQQIAGSPPPVANRRLPTVEGVDVRPRRKEPVRQPAPGCPATLTKPPAASGGPALFCSRFIPVRRAAVGDLRFGGEFLADCSPGSGRGRRANGARECAVLAGDVSGTHVGRGARRPGLPRCRCQPGRFWLLTSAGSSSQCVPDLWRYGRWNDCETARWFGDDPRAVTGSGGRDSWND